MKYNLLIKVATIESDTLEEAKEKASSILENYSNVEYFGTMLTESNDGLEYRNVNTKYKFHQIERK